MCLSRKFCQLVGIVDTFYDKNINASTLRFRDIDWLIDFEISGHILCCFDLISILSG